MTKSELSPFHLAFPVHSLDAARKFYGEVMGLAEGRSCESWIDFDFFIFFCEELGMLLFIFLISFIHDFLKVCLICFLLCFFNLYFCSFD